MPLPIDVQHANHHNEQTLSWCPVDQVAASLAELLLSDCQAYPIYHIENPSRQPWDEMTPLIAAALDIPRDNIIPFKEWLNRVRQFPGSTETLNPAGRLVGFLENHFQRMDCGGLILDTVRSQEHSQTLRSLGPVDYDLVKKYIQAWKQSNFLEH